MANQITDNRTLVVDAENATPWDDPAGSASGTLDSEIFISGSNAMAYYTTSTRDGLLYDAGSVQTAWANKVFYIWFNCGVAGLLDTKANGGVTVRFCGNTVTDWFEVNVAGSDDYPTAISGGWVQFAVDIEEAHANSSATNGTKPATNAIRYIGVTTVTGGTMPRMADNTWVDEIRYLDNSGATPGIIIEGRNGGSTDWGSAEINTQLGTAVGTFLPAPGGAWKVNTPVQFGINDTTTHGFTDTNAVWLWDDQEFIADGFYGLSALGNSGGTTNVTFGVKTGTGDDATGAQGLTIASASTGPRWFIDFNDPDLDAIGLYGCSFQHGEEFLLDDVAVSCISTLYIDCNSALVSSSEQLRCSVINANTADGVAFMTTDDLTDIVFCSFAFSDGHGVELTTPRVATQTSKGNLFSGYGSTGTNDAAVYNNSGGAVTINVSNGGDSPTYRNGTSATTTVNNNIAVTFTGMRDNTEVRVYDAGDGSQISGIENATAGGVDNRSFTWTDAAANVVDYVIHHETYENIRVEGFTVPSSDSSIPIQQRLDRNYNNP